MQLFPYTLIRIGGLPFEELEQFNLEALELTEEAFNTQLFNIRLALQEIAAHPNLQNGLVLSAPSLIDRISSFIKKTPEQFRKKERQTERTIMQFLARMVTKTSPFSTFSQIGTLPIMEQSKFLENTLLRGNKSHIRLNNYLLKYFKDLLLSDTDCRKYLPLKLGATVYPKDGGYEFLTNSNNVEAFQTIADNPVVDWIVETLQANSVMLFKDLIDKMEESIEASRVDLEQFVYQLYEIGLLEFDFGISGLKAHWIADLKQTVQQIPENTLSKMLDEILNNLENYSSYYAIALPKVRRQVLHEQLSLLQQNFESLEIETNTINREYFKKELDTTFQFNSSNLFYEDYSVDVSASVSKEDLQEIARILDAFYTYLSPLNQSPQRLALEHFYKRTFNNQTIPLLEFYKSYAQWKQKNAIDIFKEKEETLIKKWENTFLANVTVKDTSVNIFLAQFEKTNEVLNLKSQNEGKSYSSFVQFFEEDRTLKGVLNAKTPGYGKYFSRFLHLFPNKVAQALLEQNSQNGEIISAEINDASYFNANIHPPLMPFEIALPNGNHQLLVEQQIPITDIAVRINQKNILELYHIKKQLPIHPFDLGFQSQDGRSELFKLLSLFSPAEFPPVYWVIRAINGQIEDNQAIRIFPRITLENQIILQRKTWLLSKDILPPTQRNNESEYAFFKRVKAWQKQHELPNELFYTVNPRELIKDKKDMRLTDGYKPQYLNFQNPILVQLFSRACKKVQTSLKLVEMLPFSNQLSKWNENHFATEFLIQWKN